jgi:hypothetical protein
MKVLPHVMRNINEFNIPAGNSHGYEILYFGVNLILVLNYRLSFDVEVKNSNTEIQVLIFSRKDVPAWKENNNSRSSQITPFYSSQGIRINDVFRPTTSDAYAFVLSNQFSNNTHDNVIKTVEVTLIHNWQQEVKESQLTDYKVQ